MGNMKGALVAGAKNVLYSAWIFLLGIGVLFILIADVNNMMVGGLWLYFISPYLLPAITTKDRKYWITFVIVVVSMFAICLCGNHFGKNEITTSLKNVYALALLGYALFCRKEIVAISNYVRSDEYRFTRNLKEREKRNDEIQSMLKRNNATDIKKQSVREEKEQKIIEEPKKVNINVCSEEEFMFLPGMSLASAKAAVENREENGAYLSLDDFVQRNKIKPHFMLQMEPIIVIGDMPEKKEKISNSRGRTLDL